MAVSAATPAGMAVSAATPAGMAVSAATLALLLAAPVAWAASDVAHQYCLVGAGPGGLQLGHFMMKAGRDYMVYERNARAGSFFETYPIHRGLISLNKRNTGRDNAMFNMRHDWNSLLDTEVTPITKRTTDRWPHADVVAEYARDFAVEQHDKGHITYNTAVKRVERDAGGGFEMTLSNVDENGAETHSFTVLCDVLVSTMGLSVPNKPDGMVGLEHCEFYANLPETKDEAFEKKKVVIFGLGNAAFETANGIAPYVDYVHVFPGRSAATHPLVSWETRYPGAVRAIHADLLDAYLLKSIDGGMQQGRLSMSADSLAIFKTTQGQKALFPFRRDERNQAAAARWPTEKTITVGYFCTDNEWSMNFVQSLGPAIFDTAMQSNVTLAEKVHQPRDAMTIAEKFAFSCSAAQLVVPVSAVNERNVDDLVRFAKEGGDPYPLTYDHVIIALGWHQDLSMYADDVTPIMMPNQKYAVMDHEYQSINVPGLYFAGTLSHGKDFKRSAGGFIHGFRYTAKALHRILETKYHSEPWPSQPPVVFSGKKTDLENLDTLVQDTMYRIDNADAPYQMVGALGDGIVFDCPRNDRGRVGSLQATYLEDVPVPWFNTVYGNASRILWTFGYNGQRRSLTQSFEGGTLFEVHMWNFQGECDPFDDTSMDQDKGKEVVVFTEQLHTEWNQQFNRAVFRKLLQGKLQAMFTGKPRKEETRRPTGEEHKRDDWVLSDIYVHFNNDLEQEVRVMPKKGGLDPFHKVKQDTTLPPGRGKQLVAIDGQDWTIEVVSGGNHHPCGGRAVKTFDVSMGKVQDALISKLLEAQELSGECPKKSKKSKEAKSGRLQRARERAEEKKAKEGGAR